jgi:tetratricopeptide (TPR) repeat protein
MAAYVRWQHGQWSDARRDSLLAERVTRGANDEAHILGMAEAAKCLLLLERDLSQADAMATEAGALAARCNVLLPVVPTSQGMLRYYEGRLDEALEYLEDARTQAKAQGDRLNEYMSNEFLTMIEVDRGDFAAALARCQPLVEIGARLREGSEYPFALGLRALSEYGLNGSADALVECLQVVREADAKARLTYLLNRAAALDIQYGHLDQALARSAEALQLAGLMERPTEILLAHLNLEAIQRARGTPGEGEHLDCIKDLMAGVVAQWARDRAAELLSRDM